MPIRHLFHRAMRSMALLSACLACHVVVGASSGSTALVTRGAYLANAGDCIACHTAPKGKPLAGGLYIDTPFGAIASPNITPDKTTGIGTWSDDDFYKLMHEGIGKHGEYIYPVMPFPWYTKVSREDVLAIKAYLFAQPQVHAPRMPNRLSFPYSVRQSLLAWRIAFFKPETFAPDPNSSAEINRGSYLVNGLTHCGECHNARPVAGASKWRESLQGGVIDNWYAPNITSDMHAGIGGWSNAEIAAFLKTGVAPGKGIAVGPMAEAVHSLSKLDDADLLAIAAYLKTTAPKGVDEHRMALHAGADAKGADTYLNFCASCHGIDGQGLKGFVPSLDQNGAVNAGGPQNVIGVVLGGLQAREAYAPMPAIGSAMSDEDIADVTNYVRQAWTNKAPPNATPGMVETLRRQTGTLMNASTADACPGVQPASLSKALTDDRIGIPALLRSVSREDMPKDAAQIVARLKGAAPGTRKADVVNGVTAAYCAVLRTDGSVDAVERARRIGQLSQLVYAAAHGQVLH